MTDLNVGYTEGYKVLYFGKDGALHSPVRRGVWTSRIMEAECSECERTAGKGCTCGIYGLADVEKVSKYLALTPGLRNGALVKVRGYGQVTEGSKGWRAERAEIVSILAPKANEKVAKAIRFLLVAVEVVLILLFTHVIVAGWFLTATAEPNARTVAGAVILSGLSVIYVLRLSRSWHRLKLIIKDYGDLVPESFDGIPVIRDINLFGAMNGISMKERELLRSRFIAFDLNVSSRD